MRTLTKHWSHVGHLLPEARHYIWDLIHVTYTLRFDTHQITYLYLLKTSVSSYRITTYIYDQYLTANKWQFWNKRSFVSCAHFFQRYNNSHRGAPSQPFMLGSWRASKCGNEKKGEVGKMRVAGATKKGNGRGGWRWVENSGECDIWIAFSVCRIIWKTCHMFSGLFTPWFCWQ